MTSVNILRQLPNLFHYADVEKFTGNANVFLTRALAKGFVERVTRGVYINRLREGEPSVEEVACFLRTPSYISCEWALNRHGLILQSPVVCTVLTLDTAVGAARNIRFGGITIDSRASRPASSTVSKPETASTWRCLKRRSSIPSTCVSTSRLLMSWISTTFKRTN